MKPRWMAVVAVLAAAFVTSGCGKRNYGTGCERATELTAPWTELNLPIDDKTTRVCASSSTEVKLRSYDWTSKSAAQSAIEAAVTGAGYAQDKCSGQACYYQKAGKQISVQPMDFKVKRKKLVTVVLRVRDTVAKK